MCKSLASAHSHSAQSEHVKFTPWLVACPSHAHHSQKCWPPQPMSRMLSISQRLGKWRTFRKLEVSDHPSPLWILLLMHKNRLWEPCWQSCQTVSPALPNRSGETPSQAEPLRSLSREFGMRIAKCQFVSAGGRNCVQKPGPRRRSITLSVKTLRKAVGRAVRGKRNETAGGGA